MILYLHGFRSSPHAFKARLLTQKLSELGRPQEFVCPQLPASPEEAITLALRLARELIAHCGRPASELTLIGSSLGGFYATWLAEHLGCRAVLLNPSTDPLRNLAQYIAPDASGAPPTMTQYHSSEPFVFLPEYGEQLRALEIKTITRPSRYFLIAATGDELLDWRDMVAHYPGVRQKIIEGSDHGLSDFAHYLDEVLAFCAAAPLHAPR